MNATASHRELEANAKMLRMSALAMQIEVMYHVMQ